MDSSGVSRAPPYSECLLRVRIDFVYTRLSRSMDSLSERIRPSSYRIGNSTVCRSYNPRYTEMQRVWAVPISLATNFRNRDFFLFLQVLRYFHFPGFARVRLLSYSSGPYRRFAQVGFPIPDIFGYNACVRSSPRSFSQLATSFIACFCQGIHRAPLVNLTATKLISMQELKLCNIAALVAVLSP